MKNQCSDFIFIFLWPISSFFYTALVIFSMNFEWKIDPNSKNKNRKIDFSFVSAHCVSSIKMGLFLRGGGICISFSKDFLIHEFFFCATFSFWYMVDFACTYAVCHTTPNEKWCNWPYIKSTIFQKLKVAQKKTHEVKNHCLQVKQRFNFYLSIINLRISQWWVLNTILVKKKRRKNMAKYFSMMMLLIYLIW